MNGPRTPAYWQTAAASLVLALVAWTSHAAAAELTLTWVDTSTDELGFSIERSIGAADSFSEITTKGPDVTTHTDTSLSVGTTYCYRVRAFNDAGYSSYSNVACATTASVVSLGVVRLGTGDGTVTSAPAGITCGTACSSAYPSGTIVTLTAAPATGSTFSGWSGGGCSGTGPCAVTLGSTTAVTATFSLPSAALSVSKVGTGSGTVTSAPAGINCGSSCAGSYPVGTAVTLTATATQGSSFAGWSGGGCSGTGTCSVTLSANAAVSATFTGQPVSPLTVAPQSLTFTKTVGQPNPPAQTVAVTTVAGQSWTTHDTMSFADVGGLPFNGTDGVNGTGSAVFQVAPSAGMSALGVGTHNNSIRVSRAGAADVVIPVQVVVGPQTVGLSVAKVGPGTGTVTSAPAGVDCGSTCTWNYSAGMSINLTAAPAAGSSFTGWSGGGCAGTGPCAVTLAAPTTVTATFALQPVALTVSKAGAGSGTVTSAPAGVDCGSTCTWNYSAGMSINLTAAPAAGSSFSGWSGGGCTGTGPCAVTLAAPTTVTATFALPSVALTVSKVGPGTGTVTSAPAGVDCGSTCTSNYPAGASITLTATPAPGSSFAGWSGGCTGIGPCTLVLDAVTGLAAINAVTASFTMTAPPSTFSDDFDRPGSSIGNGWSVPTGSFSILYGELRNGTQKTRHLAVQEALDMARGHLSARFTSSNNNRGPAFGLVFGYQGASDYYAAYRRFGGTAVLKIVRVLNGTETVLAKVGAPNIDRGKQFAVSVSFEANQVTITSGSRSATASGLQIGPGAVGLMVDGNGSSHAIDNFMATP